MSLPLSLERMVEKRMVNLEAQEDEQVEMGGQCAERVYVGKMVGLLCAMMTWELELDDELEKMEQRLD